MAIEEGTKARALREAQGLLQTFGFNGFSFQHIADLLGIKKPSLYDHFKSKEDILTSVFEFMYAASNQEVSFNPESIVKDEKSFIKLYVDIKKAQLDGFKKFLGVKKLKFNRFLFFFEAINENNQLKKFGTVALEHEIKFLEKFIG